MDPLGNQPAQPNPQPAVTPTPPPAAPAPNTVSPVTEATRPAAVTPPVMENIERPVEAWPPAGTPAAEEVANIAVAPTPPTATAPINQQTEAQTVGTEVAEAAGAIPVISPTPGSAASSMPQDMNGFSTPAAQEIKNSIATNPAAPVTDEAPMSDTQADKLFQEEPATKARNKKHKIKKVLVGLLILAIALVAAAGAYIFFFGNKAAQSYVDTSNVTAYKDSFSQIQTALGKQPVDTAELEAGFNKLKVASENSKALAPIALGTINPNYKKAKQLADLEVIYKAEVEAYQSKYADYTEYLKALSDSFSIISSIEELKDIDLAVTTAEKITTDLTTLVKDCAVASKALGDTAKPTELGDSSKAVQDYLVKICTESMDSLQQVPLAFLVGKTGILNAADQATLKGYFNAYKNLTALIAFASEEANVEELTTYQQSALEGATKLLQQAEAIIKG